MRNLYAVLEVPPSADQKDIRTAYRRLARVHHPDYNGGKDERFKELVAAYEVLSEETRRAEYDRQREAWLRAQGGFPCAACGHGIRVPPGWQGAGRCARCKAEFASPPPGLGTEGPLPPETDPGSPLMAFVAERLREHGQRVGNRVLVEAAKVAEQISDEAVAQMTSMALEGVRSGFQSLRERLWEGRGGSGRRPHGR